MDKFWPIFIEGFCKVEFLCYTGEPNWLGWGVIGFGTLSVTGVVLTLFISASR